MLKSRFYCVALLLWFTGCGSGEQVERPVAEPAQQQQETHQQFELRMEDWSLSRFGNPRILKPSQAEKSETPNGILVKNAIGNDVAILELARVLEGGFDVTFKITLPPTADLENPHVNQLEVSAADIQPDNLAAIRPFRAEVTTPWDRVEQRTVEVRVIRDTDFTRYYVDRQQVKKGSSQLIGVSGYWPRKLSIKVPEGSHFWIQGVLVARNANPMWQRCPVVEKLPARDLTITDTVKTPHVYDDAVIGASGRLLLFRHPAEKKLSIFDIRKSAFVGEVPLLEKNSLFAAGADKLFVLHPEKKQLERWSLETFKQETSTSLAPEVKYVSMAMGYSAQTPLIVLTDPPLNRSFVFFDTQKLVPIEQQRKFSLTSSQKGEQIVTSADGTTFSLVGGPQRFVAKGAAPFTNWNNTSVRGTTEDALPDAHGELMLGKKPPLEVSSSNLTWFGIGKTVIPFGLTIPSIGSVYFLDISQEAVAPEKGKNPSFRVSIYVPETLRPLAVFRGIELPNSLSFRSTRLLPSERLLLIPSEKRLLTLPDSNDRVIVRDLDMDKVLEQCDFDYMFAEGSRHAGSIAQGTTVKHSLNMKSKRGGVKYRFAGGTPNTFVESGGVLSVTAPTTSGRGSRNFGATYYVSDASGQQLRYGLLGTSRPPEVSSETVVNATKSPPPKRPTPSRPTAPTPRVPTPRVPTVTSVKSPKTDFHRLSIDHPTDHMTVTDDGRHLVLAQEKANRIELWDIQSQKSLKIVNTPAPRFVLCREKHAYVASYAQSDIRVFSLPDWKQTNHISLVQPGRKSRPQPYYLSAPQGKYFDGVIIASCETGGRSDDVLTPCFVVNTETGSSAQVSAGHTLAYYTHVDYRGRHAFIQASSKRSGLLGNTFRYENLRIYKQGEAFRRHMVGAPSEFRRTPFLSQVREGRYWFGGRRLLMGDLPTSVGRDQGMLVVPDRTQDVFYVFHGTKLECRALDLPLSTVGERKFQWGDPLASSSASRRPSVKSGQSTASPTKSPPIALTQEGALHFFLHSEQDGVVLHAKETAFTVSQDTVAAIKENAQRSTDLPRTIPAGKEFKFWIFGHPVPGPFNVSFKPLSRNGSAPIKPTVSQDGLLTWTPPSGLRGEFYLDDGYKKRQLAVVERSVGGVVENDPAGSTSTPKLTSIKFPELIEDVVVGGSGRYAILFIRKMKRLAIFDFQTRKVIKQLTLPSEDIAYAAGARKLFIHFRDKSVIQRWNLTTLERELTQTLNMEQSVLTMGSASEGPLLVSGRAHSRFLDPKTLQKANYQWPGHMHVSFSPSTQVRASANGQVFTAWRSGTSPTGLSALKISGNKLTQSYQHQSVGYVVPSPDGQVLYTAAGTFTNETNRIGSLQKSLAPLPVPSIRGHFVVKFPRADPTKRGPQLGPMTSGTLHLQGETSPLLTFHGLPNPVIGNERFSKGKLTLEQRFLFNPTEGLMVTVGATQLHLYSFDLEQALRGSGKDFLFVSSQAPSSVTLGSQFNYQIEAHSKEAVSYKLDSYPKGMTITKQGKLIWPVSNVSEGETESVVVVVKSASGKEIFHVFDLRIESGDTQLASNAKPKPSEPPTPSEETPPESDSDSEVIEREIPAGSLEILPARLRTESVKFKLPASIDSACVGARGRYIFLLMSSLNKLAVFDTSRARIVKYLPVDGRKTFFAAGREKLIMVSDSKRIISRWNLRNFERELAVPLKVSGPLRDIVMGSDSQGPLLIGETNRYDSVMHMMDIKTMRMINIEGKGRIRLRTLWRMAADGSVIGTWSVGLSPSGLQTILLNGNRMRGFSEHTSVGHIVPGPDGRYVYTGTGVYTNQLKPLSSDTKMRKPTIPSIHGDYYLGVVMNRNARKPEGVNLEVYQAGDTRLLHTIKGIPALSGRIFNRGNRTIGFDKRVMYIPDAELLVVIPHTNDHLYLLHFDLFESLDQSGVDYLFVTSRSPSTAVSGGEYRYKIAVRSKQGDVRLKLESAPEGMELDGDELLWDVPDQVDDANPIILISVGDSSGQEIFHKIELKVIGAEEAATIASTPSTPKPPLPTSPKRTSPPSTSPGPFAPRQRKAKDQPVRVAENRLEIPDGEFSLVTGHENKSLLLLQGKRITTLGPEGHTIHRTAELPEAFSHLEDRQGYYVGVNDARVSLIDKGTLQQIRTMPLSGTKVQDMVLHPRRPITYIARTTKDQPIPHFLVFDELTGKARQSKDYSGNQLAIGARGKMLLTRMRVNFKDLPIKLQQGFVIKNAITYRTFLYRLGRGGEPYVLDHSTRHSWSSRVWELSSDGKRLAESRSGVGYVFSNPTDLKELPVTFETGGFRGRSNLDFHPVFSWAACLTQDGPVLVNPETATMISDRLPADLSKQIGGASVRSLRFSPDGKRLLVHLRTGHIDDLLSLALRLEKEEVSALQNHFESLDKSTETSKPKRVVPLREFESLAGGIGGDLLPKDISQASSDSIVVVRQGEESSGTGFVIGSDGYIFTCAHCVDGTEKPSVSYRVKQKDDKVIVKSSPASIIHRDYERDLALLKIEVEKPLPPVRLGFISKMTSGEQVTVIANPGVGRTILDHTITTGVVSNPKRTFQGLDFIQTSAAVNPGSSGGALFNSQGFVCGMVVLKASIEGAGFAIPSSDLVEFVLSVSDFSGENTQLVREWLDSTGQRSVKAKFIRLEEDSVTISRVDDNREFSLKREALHQQDQSFIRLLEMNASVQRK